MKDEIHVVDVIYVCTSDTEGIYSNILPYQVVSPQVPSRPVTATLCLYFPATQQLWEPILRCRRSSYIQEVSQLWLEDSGIDIDYYFQYQPHH